MNFFEEHLKKTSVKLEVHEKKQITRAVSWKNQAAEKVIKKIHTEKPNPTYGLYDVCGQVIEYKADGELRDFENVPLNPLRTVNELNEEFFKNEILPHVEDAWIDSESRDLKDKEIGIVSYEIPFNRHFYLYQPPRNLTEIDQDLDKVSNEIMNLLQEVHS
jgi:type I restriction enzyme M protein